MAGKKKPGEATGQAARTIKPQRPLTDYCIIGNLSRYVLTVVLKSGIRFNLGPFEPGGTNHLSRPVLKSDRSDTLMHWKKQLMVEFQPVPGGAK